MSQQAFVRVVSCLRVGEGYTGVSQNFHSAFVEVVISLPEIEAGAVVAH
jgi:hypothetical protein